MLETIVIIWLVIGFIVSLSTFFADMWHQDYMVYTLGDLVAFILGIFAGPVIGVAMLLSEFIDLDDIELFVHHRRR